jgi:hypothetical protein
MWVSCDPLGLVDGIDLYIYARSNPINHIDPAGTDSHSNQDLQAWKKEMLAEIAVMRADINRLRETDIADLKADALNAYTNSLEAKITAEKSAERAEASAKRARRWTRIAAVPKLILASAGGAVSCAAAETGIGAAGCIYALDTAHSAARELVAGEPTPTFAHEVIARPLEAAGVNKNTADTIGSFGEVAFGGYTSAYSVARSYSLSASTLNTTRLLGESAETLDEAAVLANREAWGDLTRGTPSAGQVFEPGANLAGSSEVTIIRHGVRAAGSEAAAVGADTIAISGVGKVGPATTAELLIQSGFEGGLVRCIACRTGAPNAQGITFGEQLSIALNNRLENPSVVAAPRGPVEIGTLLGPGPVVSGTLTSALTKPDNKTLYGIFGMDYF